MSEPKNSDKEVKSAKRGPSFRDVPKFTSGIDKAKEIKENSLNAKDSFMDKIPKTIRNLRLSKMQTFVGLTFLSGYLTFKALKDE